MKAFQELKGIFAKAPKRSWEDFYLEHKMTRSVKDFIAKQPSSVQGIYERALSGQSRATAVKAKCLDCTGNQRQEVSLCTVNTCPLYPYRPYQSKENNADFEASEEIEELI